MYIAFKWLSGLAVVMWIGLCSIDIYIRNSKENGTGLLYDSAYKNISIRMERSPRVEHKKNKNGSSQSEVAMLHCTMFLAGAFAVSVFNKKSEILIFTKTKIAKINFRIVKQFIIAHSINASKSLWKNIIITFVMKVKDIFNVIKRRDETKLQKINLILLNKLKEIGEERKTLGQLLIAALHENKVIRMQYQLQSMTKNRLLQQIDNSQKKVKENRSKYLSFQHLYLVIHQENMFLKARIGKLIQDKDTVEKNLLGVINEIYRSKNNELKLYCSRLIVQTRENFLNSDVSVEIRNFLRQIQRCKTNSSKCQVTDEQNFVMARNWSECSSTHIAEVSEGDDSMPLVADAPRLKGLPGEYVWTVKDKNGVIEKLYELDYEADLDNGDTIRRIRQYSVYFDKDCLLDYSNSRTVIYDSNTDTSEPCTPYSMGYPLMRGRLVTGSEVFQKFLRDNNNIVSTRRPSLICG